MEKVAGILVVVTITLLACEGILLAIRASRCARRREPLCLSAFLLALALGLAVPSWIGSGSILSVLILWAAGAFMIEARRMNRHAAWTAACALFIALLVMGSVLGFGGTIAFTVFDAAATCGLAAFPVGLMAGIGRGSRSPPLFVALVSACIWIALACAHSVLEALAVRVPDFSSVALLVLAIAGAWLVFQEGYPSRAGWRGALAALELQEKLPHAAYARVVENETALARQDRLVAAGLLVLGVAHEFKNTLAYIKAVAEDCLEEAEERRRNDGLRLLLDHVEAGRESAVSLLESLAREGREQPQVLDARKDLEPFLRIVRAGYRAEGIQMRSDLREGVRFISRKGELEQVLHNLVRNAVESLRSRGVAEEKVIELSTRRAGLSAIVEVRDNAGGVPQPLLPRLFAPSFSEKDASGLGLYLSKSLARDNGGFLEHVPVDGGSIFRLTFPAVEIS